LTMHPHVLMLVHVVLGFGFDCVKWSFLVKWYIIVQEFFKLTLLHHEYKIRYL
jgi:hypothetical protein